MKQSAPMEDQEKQEFIESQNVSRETIGKLERYAKMLGEWNLKFNLIAESTFPHIWRRHFLDSAQFRKLIPPEAVTIADLGSGAGLPGLVLSIMGVSGLHLIESIGKKARFLQAVIDDLKLDATVLHMRVESIHNMKFDVVTARALKPLPQLLKLANPLMHKDSLCVFLKGRQLKDELTEAGKYWKFNAETFQSLSDHSGSVLTIRNLKPGRIS
ncbi:MAG: 16S rRNA (guanine(527)-N(7))-methyltransferase RsmG [Bdellovibrionales bacterium]